MAFTLDTETQKITFGVVADGTNDAISIPLADQFGATEDFTNDFSTTVGWTTESSATYDISTGVLNFSTPTGLVNTTAGTYDIGTSLSDTQWVIRFKLDITNKVFTGDQSVIYIGMSDTLGAGTANNQDGIFLNLNVLTSLIHDIRIKDVNGERPDSTPADSTFSHGLVVETLYGELKRTSATTYEGSLYSDPNYTALIETKTGTCSSAITGLRYFQLEVDTRTTTTGNLAGSIDNLQVWDGISTPVIRSDNWRIRFKLDYTNLNDGGSSTDTSLLIGLSSTDATLGSSDAQDGFFIISFVDTGGDFYYVVTPDNQGPIVAPVDDTFSTSPAVGTTHYIEMRKDSASQTTVSIYSDATFTTLIESEVQAGISGSDNLRYLKLMNDESNTVVGSAIDGTFDDFSFVDLADLTGTNSEIFTIDGILKIIQPETFTIDAIKKGIFNKTFTIDGLLFAPPAILYLIDARLTTADFGDFRDIGDLIIRVLVENPAGLSGNEIVDEIRIITEMEPEWGFLGKKHRIKGWINFLFKNGTIQNDNSDPDWWQTVWTLV